MTQLITGGIFGFWVTQPGGENGGQANATQAIYPGEGYRVVAAGGGRVGPRQTGRRGLPRVGHLRTELLSLAQRVWRFETRAGAAHEGLGEGERPLEKSGGRADAGQADPERGA